MKRSFLHIVRLVTFLVALQILNLDFFIQDGDGSTTISSTNSNDNDDDIDSVVKYISEVVVKKIKAIHRNNNKPNKHLQSHKHMGLKMIELQQPRFAKTEISFREAKSSSFIKNYYYQFCKEINPPPPKS